MNYYFNENKLTTFTKELITIEPTDIKETFCIDELGFKLLNTLKGKISVDSCLRIGKSKIALLNDKPPQIDLTSNWSCKIDTKYLRKAVKFTDNNKTRPILNGVYINESGTIMATDSFKIYAYNLNKAENSCVLSKDFINKLIKYNGEVELHVNFNGVFTQIEDTIIFGRVYNGQYPILDKVFNSDFEKNNLPSNFNELLEIGSLIPEAKVKIENNTIEIKGEINEICEVLDLPINICFKLENAKICLNSVNSCDIYTTNRLIMFSNGKERAITTQIQM